MKLYLLPPDKNQFSSKCGSSDARFLPTKFALQNQKKMETTLQQKASLNYTERIVKPSILSRFFNWCNEQETYRFGWLGGIIAIHGCVLTPITLFAVILSGANLALFIAAIVAMGMSLVTNLAAMPTKVTIPVFFTSVLVDLVIIALCVSSGFNLAGANL